MRIKESAIQAWLNSVSTMQHKNDRFVQVVAVIKAKRGGVFEVTIKADSDLIEGETLEIRAGETLTIPGVYFKFSMNTN